MMHGSLKPALISLLALAGSLSLAACVGSASPMSGPTTSLSETIQGAGATQDHGAGGPDGTVTLAFAGDMANNHGADYGPVGLADTLRAIRHSPIPVIGIGEDKEAAFTPYRVSVGDTDLAFFAADASFREGSSSVWEAGTSNAGVAAAHDARPRDLLDAVRAANAIVDVVVVYLHWGEELQSCPAPMQRITASALAEAGADVVVGTHAHVQLGSGWLGDTYVNYGLGNFLWYHNHQPEPGVLKVVIREGEVVDDSWTPARIQTFGRPLPLRGRSRADAIADWRGLRECAGLSAAPPPVLTPYRATASRIGRELQVRMRHSHHPGCPVLVADLRYLRLTYVGFDGNAHTGELVVHRRYRTRTDLPPGVICANDVVVRAFADIGWVWGGTWSPYPDFQHFAPPKGTSSRNMSGSPT